MPLTITVTRYTTELENEGPIPESEKDVTVYTIEPTDGYSAVEQAADRLDCENWEASYSDLDRFRHSDCLSARYPNSDCETEDGVTAVFSKDWPLADMRAVVKRVCI